MEGFEWRGFAKVWLWICLVFNCLSVLALLGGRSFGMNPIVMILGIIASAMQITGVVLLLFKKKKIGFYIVCGAAAIAVVENLLNGSVVMGLLGALIGVGILYLAIRKSLDQLA